MLTAAIYARYSSGFQRPTSIDDQVAHCREAAARLGCHVVPEHIYADHELSGSLVERRQGYQGLLRAAKDHSFEAIIVEGQDRLWRNQAEMHIALRRLRFWGIKVFAIDSGADLTDKSGGIVAAVTGWRDETFIDSLREKIHRGTVGQVRRGFSAGGRAYSYRSEPVYDQTRRDTYGNPVVVGYRRKIDDEEAAVVRQIFELYAGGLSAKTIAHRLNADGVPSPRWRAGTPRRGWTWTTIAGSAQRVLGILNNPLYVGRLIWNRSQKTRDPDSGARIMRARPEAEWITTEVPELRVVSDELWQRVKDRQVTARREAHHTKGRPLRHMFSGLLRCDVCGGPFIIKSGHYYGCANNINRGPAICVNTRLVRRDLLEGKLLRVIEKEILNPEAIAYLTQRINERLRQGTSAHKPAAQRELKAAREELEHIKDAIRQGIISPTTRSMLAEAEVKIARLEAALRVPDVLAHRVSVLPQLVEHHIRNLHHVMAKEPEQARTILRKLVGEVTLKPNRRGLLAVLRGNVSGILDLSPDICDTIGAGRGI